MGRGGWRRRVIVVDSSAVVVILFGEPSAPDLLIRLAADPDRMMSVASYLETGIALAAVDAAQARLALQARIRFGRGMGHGGLLNFGDAFSYALARTQDAPLLFIGDDFGTTDVEVALD